jgi:multidrug resistance efflux pump
MTRRTGAALAGFVLAVIVVIVLFVDHRRAPAQQVETNAAPSVGVATARFGTFVSHVRAQGRVGAPAGGDAKLSFSGSGILARVVHVGDSVVAGEPLAELDASGLAIDAAQAGADAQAAAASYGGGAVPAQVLASAERRLSAQDALRQARAKVANDERTLVREQTLFAGGVAAQKDVDAARQQLALDQADVDAARSKATSASAGIGGALLQARADVAQAESDVRAAQAQAGVTAAQATSAQDRLAAAQRNLANGVLRAPAAGVVVTILKHPGEAIDPTQPALVVGPPRSSVVTVTVTGDAARTIHPGATAVVSIPARGARADAVVRALVPSVDPATQTSTVVLSGAPAGAASGDAVEASIAAETQRGVLIPTEAIVEDPQTGHAIVFVRQKGKDGNDTFVSREVTVAAGDDQTTMVASGLRRRADRGTRCLRLTRTRRRRLDCRRDFRSELERGEHQEDRADERDERAAEHLTVAFERAEAHALQSGGRRNAKRDVRRDRAHGEHDRHDREQRRPELHRGEEGGDPFDHRRRAEDQQERRSRRILALDGCIRRCECSVRRGRAVVRIVMRVVVVMVVAVRAVRAQLEPRRDRDPTAERDQGEAREQRDRVSEPSRDGDAGDPDDEPDRQGRDHVAGSGAQCGAGGLASRPAALTGDQGDRHPVVGDQRVQHADGRHGRHQQNLRSGDHRGRCSGRRVAVASRPPPG